MTKARWEVQNKNVTSSFDVKKILAALLENREIKNIKEFLKPKTPDKITFSDLDILKKDVEKVIKRIKQAKKDREHVIIYGDYDADGICATAILWEALHKMGMNALPYLPERFSEGYGINPSSVEKLKKENSKLKLIITVDNGIVAHEGIKKANELGIDVIVIDHHQKEKSLPKVCGIVHSTKTCGAVLSWLVARRLGDNTGLELAAIGTITDQMPLTGVNRSVVKWGLEILKRTKRLGLRAIMREASLEKIGVYEIGYIIGPRLNAAGRLTHAIESLRLLCTRNFYRANDLSLNLGKVNKRRQKIVSEVLKSAENKAKKSKDKIIVISGKNYHEGVIGLAAGKITQKFYRPSIVLSVNGKIAKASARSIDGFNIIKAIKKLKDLIIEGGGHPMAAGFSIETKNIKKFTSKINKIANKKMTAKTLQKKVKIDLELEFNQINQKLMDNIKKLEPFGLGNPAPIFLTKRVEVKESKKVGKNGAHLKLKLQKDDTTFDAIFFNTPESLSLSFGSMINVVYNFDENTWNGTTTIQLKVKDIRLV